MTAERSGIPEKENVEVYLTWMLERLITINKEIGELKRREGPQEQIDKRNQEKGIYTIDLLTMRKDEKIPDSFTLRVIHLIPSQESELELIGIDLAKVKHKRYVHYAIPYEEFKEYVREFDFVQMRSD